MIGRHIDSYKIVKEIGSDGFGTVYLGENILDSRIQVALKVAKQELSEDLIFVEALKKEYFLLYELDCPQIVRFQGLSQIDGQLVLIMEFLEGEELRDRLDREKISVSESFRIVTEVLKGLEHSHSRDIIHRDIKPSNIFLCKDGQVKLLDFGISKAMGKTSTGQSSQMLSGTLNYMSPERFRNEFGGFSDIYAVGLVLWEMLSGKPACIDGPHEAKIFWHMSEGASDIRQYCSDLTEGQARFVMQMCERDPQKRPQNGKEALELLKNPTAGETEVLDRKEVEDVVFGNTTAKSGDTVSISKNEIEDVVVQKKGGTFKWFMLVLLLLSVGVYFYVESEREVEAERQARIEAEEKAEKERKARLDLQNQIEEEREARIESERQAKEEREKQAKIEADKKAETEQHKKAGKQRLGVFISDDYFQLIKPEDFFMMGCTSEKGNDCNSDEKPSHRVFISRDYYMGKYEVTQGLYQEVMGENPSHFSAKNFSICESDCPIESVSWYDAIAFLNKLSDRDGYQRCYEGDGNNIRFVGLDCEGYRLPTEAEWEYASRGGQNFKYAGSDNVDDVAWHSGNSEQRTHPVGEKKANGYGLYDMSGNVYEWVLGGKSSYSESPMRDPLGILNASDRVIRGGSWVSYARYARVSDRNSRDPSRRNYGIGFRISRTLSSP